MNPTGKEAFLRKSLLANAVFTVVSGLGLVVFAHPLAAVMGVVGAFPLRIVGVVLLLYAVDLFRTVFEKRLARGRILYFIAMDALWVIGSVVLLWGLAVPFTPAGQWIILMVADVVGVFAVLQYVGLRKTLRGEVDERLAV